MTVDEIEKATKDMKNVFDELHKQNQVETPSVIIEHLQRHYNKILNDDKQRMIQNITASTQMTRQIMEVFQDA